MTFLKKLALTLAVAVALVQPILAQDTLSTVAIDAQAKLENAIKRLSAQRDVTALEKVPLAKERDSLFAKLRETRREADRAQRVSDNQSADLTAFEVNLKAQSEVVDYVINLSAEFGRTLGSQLDPSEVADYRDMISAGEAAAEDPYADPLAK